MASSPPWPKVHADIYNALGTPDSVQFDARLVLEPNLVDRTQARPTDQIRESEVKNTEVRLHIQGQSLLTSTDAEGAINLNLSEALAKSPAMSPGRKIITVTPPDEHDRELGRGWVNIMPPQSDGIVVLSDIDLTYLNTHFHRTTDKMSLLREDARARVTLPGMAELYQGLREDCAHDATPAPLAFLSGSPRFFKRVIEGKLSMDGVVHDALMLKPFKALAWRALFNWRPHRIVQAFREQVGYKLGAMLLNRLRLPAGVAEILLGDDSEADFVVYNLYTHILQGAWRPADLNARLKSLSVTDAERETITLLASRTRAHVTARPAVRFIGIRQTGHDNKRFDMARWTRPEMRHHADTLELAEHLHEAHLISAQTLTRVEGQTSPDPLPSHIDLTKPT